MGNAPYHLDPFTAFETRDVEVARSVVPHAFGDFSLDVGDHPHRFAWRATLARLGPLVAVRSRARGAISLEGSSSSVILLVSDTVGEEVSTPEVALTTSPGRQAVVYSERVPCRWRSSGTCATTALRFEPAFLLAQLEALTGAPGRAAPRFQLEMVTDRGAGAAIGRLVRLVAAELDRGADALAHPVVVAQVAETLARALLVGHPHDHAHLVARARRSAGVRAARMVEEFLAANPGAPLLLSEIAALAGHGLGALDAAFRARRGRTVAEFLGDLRLDAARRRLLDPASGVTVATVAAEAGFLRRERFESAYRARFGEAPIAIGTAARRPAPPTSRERVAVLHEDPARRQALAAALEAAGYLVDAHPSGLAFLASSGAPPGCAVVDLRLSDLGGPELQAALGRAGRAPALVFLAEFADVLEAVQVMKGGAVDLLVEPWTAADLIAAVRRAFGHPTAGRPPPEELTGRLAALSPREREVCALLGQGLLNKQIAAELGISERTVKAHRARVMARLGVRTAAEMGRLLGPLPER